MGSLKISKGNHLNRADPVWQTFQSRGELKVYTTAKEKIPEREDEGVPGKT